MYVVCFWVVVVCCPVLLYVVRCLMRVLCVVLLNKCRCVLFCVVCEVLFGVVVCCSFTIFVDRFCCSMLVLLFVVG